MDITCLPATALKAVGAHLGLADAAACRLASKQLAAVTAKHSSTGHIHVVASYFQSQLQKDKEKGIANASSAAAAAAAETAVAGNTAPANEPTVHPAAAAAAVDASAGESSAAATTDAPAGDVAPANTAAATLAELQDLCILPAAASTATLGAEDNAASKQPASTPAGHTHPSSSSSSSSTTVQELSTIQSPALSSTARSLAKAAAAYRCAVIYIDADVQFHDDTWQQLFRALSSCRSMQHLRVVQCKRPRSDPFSVSPAARYVSFAWLPALVSLLKPHLQQLQLQLVASIPQVLQPLLLELQGLKTLETAGSDLYGGGNLYGTVVQPLLLPSVVIGLSRLRFLQSLKCRMAASFRPDLPDTVVQLQHTFKQLGRTLTQLDFGLADRSTQIALSAPLQDMPLLQSLTCQAGFSLDAEDILYPDLDLDLGQNQENIVQPGSSSNSSMDTQATAPALLAAAAAAPLVPSLTRLVLNEGHNHGPLFRLLAQGTPGAAAAASRTLLQHVELNSPAEVPFELLCQLSGLRSLKFTVWEDGRDATWQELAAQTSLTSQLSGLTVVCTQPDADWDEWFHTYRPIPRLTGLTALTSLRISGAPGIHICIHQDLNMLQAAMPRLQQFSFSGSHKKLPEPAHSAGQPAPAHPANAYDAGWGSNQLRVLNLNLHDEDLHLQWCKEAAATAQARCFTSVKVTGCSSGFAGGRGPSDKLNPAEISSSSSSSGAQHCGGGCGWPDLVQLTVTVDGMSAAEDFASLNRALPDLTLDLRLEPDVIKCPGSSSSSSSSGGGSSSSRRGLWDESWGAMPGIADLWPHLTSLKLTVPGDRDGFGGDPKGLDALLQGLSSLTNLDHLSLTCANSTSLPPGCESSFTFLQSLPRLQTLELNFKPLHLSILDPPVPVPSVHLNVAQRSDEPHVEETAHFWDVLAGSLQQCSRLRKLVLGKECTISERQLQQLQSSVSNCLVYVQYEL